MRSALPGQESLTWFYDGLFGPWLYPEQDAHHVKAPHQELVRDHDDGKRSQQNDRPPEPARDGPRVDFQKTRASKTDPCTRYYEQGAFDVLAACLHPVTESWEFQYCCTSKLDPHPTCSNRLSQKVIVAGDIWCGDVRELLDIGC